MSESQGERGPTGQSGVAGRQGEAGVSGPRGEAGKTGEQGPPGLGVHGETGETGDTGKIGKTGPRGRSFSNGQVLVIFLVVVLAFGMLAFRTDRQQRQIQHNSDRIEHVLLENARTQYAICTTRNEGIRRQNALIDSAIAAEKRKPKPDLVRIRDLTNFKGALPDCGKRP